MTTNKSTSVGEAFIIASAASVAGVLGFLLFAAFVFLLSIWSAVCLVPLWGWFMVPLGVPQIGLWWAIGLGAVAALFTPTMPPWKDGKAKEHMVAILAKPPLALALGWLAHQFM